MQIALELPEDIAKRLELAWRDVSRGTLEAIAVEGYREGVLTRGQVERLLGLSFWETEAFLKERQAYLAYTEEDFEQDRRDEGDEEIARIREVRHRISEQFGHDPYRLVAYYMELQKEHPEKLVPAPDSEMVVKGRS